MGQVLWGAGDAFEVNIVKSLKWCLAKSLGHLWGILEAIGGILGRQGLASEGVRAKRGGLGTCPGPRKNAEVRFSGSLGANYTHLQFLVDSRPCNISGPPEVLGSLGVSWGGAEHMFDARDLSGVLVQAQAKLEGH